MSPAVLLNRFDDAFDFKIFLNRARKRASQLLFFVNPTIGGRTLFVHPKQPFRHAPFRPPLPKHRKI
jgi:hypothetical protein